MADHSHIGFGRPRTAVRRTYYILVLWLIIAVVCIYGFYYSDWTITKLIIPSYIIKHRNVSSGKSPGNQFSAAKYLAAISKNKKGYRVKGNESKMVSFLSSKNKSFREYNKTGSQPQLDSAITVTRTPKTASLSFSSSKNAIRLASTLQHAPNTTSMHLTTPFSVQTITTNIINSQASSAAIVSPDDPSTDDSYPSLSTTKSTISSAGIHTQPQPLPPRNRSNINSAGIPLVSNKLTANNTSSSTRLTTVSMLSTYRQITSTRIPVNSASPRPSASVTCKFPHLLINDLSIKKYLTTYKPLQCSQMPNWVYTQGGNMYISSNANKKYGKISCDYYDIYRKDDNHWDWTIYHNVSNGTKLKADAFQVVCNSSSGVNYRNLHLGVPYRLDLLKKKPRSDAAERRNKNSLGWNILIYLMDSMSRVNFLRKLPKFSETLSKKMGAITMEGFNIVGDGTPWTMIPVTTGHFQAELYEARKRFKNASYLDDWPFIFKDFKRANYVTAYAEEQPAYSFLSYKLKGFKKPPVDHYLRMFEQAISYVKSEHKPYCLGNTSRSLILNHWWREFQDMYRPHAIKTFSILFSSETSHDDYNLVQTLDEHWENVFREQFDAGYFNDTFLVVMGDHGRRFGPIRTTQSGKTEEKFFAFVVPSSFKKQYPRCWANFLTNVNRLVTPFDLYETLQAILRFDPKVSCTAGNIRQRGIPLFQEISPFRTCRYAWIKPHFCSCLEWEPIPSEQDAKNATDFVLKEFNKLIAVAGNLCAPLRLGRLVWSRQLHPNQNLMAFKQTEDYDNIFPDLTANANLTSILYQLRFITLPNNGDYEVSVTHYVDLNQYAFSADDVSRLDMYGDQPHCIMNTHHQLRQYCICKDKLML